MTMTSTTQRFNVANALEASKTIKNVDRQWKRLPGDQQILPGYFGWGKEIPHLSENYKHFYVKDETKPRVVTIDAVNDSTTTITLSTLDTGTFGIGTLLYFPDGEVMRVEANLSTTTKTVERGFSTSTAAAKSTAASRKAAVGMPVIADEETFPEKGKFRGDLAFVHPTIVAYKYGGSALRSTQRSWVTQSTDELAEEKQRFMIEKMNELEVMMLYGIAQEPTSTAPGSFDGLDRSITTNTLNLAGQPITLSHYADMAQKVRRTDPAGQVTILGGYTQKRIFDGLLEERGVRQYDTKTNEVGVTFDKVHLNGGSVDFLTVPILEDTRPDLLFVVRKDDIKLHAVKHRFGSGWLEGKISVEMNQKLVEETFTYNIFTFLVKNEKRHYKAYNVSSSSADYETYV